MRGVGSVQFAATDDRDETGRMWFICVANVWRLAVRAPFSWTQRDAIDDDVIAQGKGVLSKSRGVTKEGINLVSK